MEIPEVGWGSKVKVPSVVGGGGGGGGGQRERGGGGGGGGGGREGYFLKYTFEERNLSE